MMANIALTDEDFTDLCNGHTINTIDDDGTEHILSGKNFASGDFEALEDGAELFFGNLRISYPD